MKTRVNSTCVVYGLLFVMIASGCSGPESKDKAPDKDAGSQQSDKKQEHGKGPHDGHVIDLGRDHEYHAELVENEDAGTMTVFILDKDLKELAIDQKSIVMNLVVKGQAKSFQLVASGATDGKASRFEAVDKTLMEALHKHHADGKLRVMINGSPHSGNVVHRHEEDE